MSTSDLYTQFDAVFFEKTRLSMMTLLHQEDTVSYNRFKILLGGTDGTIYGHARKLLETGYIKQKKQITGDRLQTIYSLTVEGRKLFKRYLRFLEELLNPNNSQEWRSIHGTDS